MRYVHADPSGLDQLATSIHAFVEAADAGSTRIKHHAASLGLRWRDAHFLPFSESVEVRLERIRRGLHEVRLLASKLDRLSEPLHAYLGGGAAVGSPTTSAEQGSGALAARSGSNARFQNKAGNALHLMPVGGFDPSTIDWVDDQFVEKFDTSQHHGHTGADYRALCSALPRVLDQLRSGHSPDVFAAGSNERKCYDSFFGGDPIRVEQLPNGRKTVTDGRHRLLACIQLGIDPPVALA